MFNRHLVEKEVQKKCYIVGFIAFVIFLLCGHFMLENYKENEIQCRKAM